MYFSPFVRQNQAEVWPRFQSLLKLPLWAKGVEWNKVLNVWGQLCLWQCLLFTCDIDRVEWAAGPIRACDCILVFFCVLVFVSVCELVCVLACLRYWSEQNEQQHYVYVRSCACDCIWWCACVLEILIGAEWAAVPTRVWGVRPLSWEDGQSHLAACSQPPTQPTLLALVSPELTENTK